MAGQPRRSGRQNSERRGGQRGNTRGKEAQKRRRTLRMQDPRVQSAAEAAKRAREDLARLESLATPAKPKTGEHVHSVVLVGTPPRYACCGALAPIPEPVVEAPAPAQVIKVPDAVGTKGWSLLQARLMLRDGYTVEHVVGMTGWGPAHFKGLPLDKEHRGLRDTPVEAWV